MLQPLITNKFAYKTVLSKHTFSLRFIINILLSLAVEECSCPTRITDAASRQYVIFL